MKLDISQCRPLAFTRYLSDNGIQVSMDGKGAWRDNVFVERFWRTVKYEHVYLHVRESTREAKSKISWPWFKGATRLQSARQAI